MEFVKFLGPAGISFKMIKIFTPLAFRKMELKHSKTNTIFFSNHTYITGVIKDFINYAIV